MVTKDTAIPARLQRIIFRGKVRSPDASPHAHGVTCAGRQTRARTCSRLQGAGRSPSVPCACRAFPLLTSLLQLRAGGCADGTGACVKPLRGRF